MSTKSVFFKFRLGRGKGLQPGISLPFYISIYIYIYCMLHYISNTTCFFFPYSIYSILLPFVTYYVVACLPSLGYINERRDWILFIYALFYDVLNVSTVWYRITGRQVNHELIRVHREAALSIWSYYPHNWLGFRSTTDNPIHDSLYPVRDSIQALPQ